MASLHFPSSWLKLIPALEACHCPPVLSCFARSLLHPVRICRVFGSLKFLSTCCRPCPPSAPHWLDPRGIFIADTASASCVSSDLTSCSCLTGKYTFLFPHVSDHVELVSTATSARTPHLFMFPLIMSLRARWWDIPIPIIANNVLCSRVTSHTEICTLNPKPKATSVVSGVWPGGQRAHPQSFKEADEGHGNHLKMLCSGSGSLRLQSCLGTLLSPCWTLSSFRRTSGNCACGSHEKGLRRNFLACPATVLSVSHPGLAFISQ